MSALPDPIAPVESRRVTYLTPLLDLIRTTAAEHGEVTFRVLPSDHPDAAVGVVSRDEPVIYLPAPDRDITRAEMALVNELHQVAFIDLDEEHDEAVDWFVRDATAHTLTAMARGGRRVSSA